MTRIAITGGPRTGKTTLAMRMRMTLDMHPRNIRHTDVLIHLGWSDASAAAALWLDEPGPWIIEGVAMARALRKWRDRHPGQRPPVDRVIRLTTPHVALSKGQAGMANGEGTVWSEVEPWLLAAGIDIIGCPRCGGKWSSCGGHREGASP